MHKCTQKAETGGKINVFFTPNFRGSAPAPLSGIADVSFPSAFIVSPCFILLFIVSDPDCYTTLIQYVS